MRTGSMRKVSKAFTALKEIFPNGVVDYMQVVADISKVSAIDCAIIISRSIAMSKDFDNHNTCYMKWAGEGNLSTVRPLAALWDDLWYEEVSKGRYRDNEHGYEVAFSLNDGMLHVTRGSAGCNNTISKSTVRTMGWIKISSITTELLYGSR